MICANVSNGRYTIDEAYQWDLNQVLEIRGLSLPSIPEIHFSNYASKEAIVKQAKMNNAGVVTVDIPNELLQSHHDVDVYICIYEGDTFKVLYKLVIPVNGKKKPVDYIAPDDEKIYSYNALENKLENTLALSLERYDEMSATLDEMTKLANNALASAEESAKSANETLKNVATAENALAESKTNYDNAVTTLNEATETLNEATETLRDAEVELSSAVEQYNASNDALTEAISQYNTATTNYETATTNYETAIERLNALPTIRSGTEDPDDSVGVDGDIYIKIQS